MSLIEKLKTKKQVILEFNVKPNTLDNWLRAKYKNLSKSPLKYWQSLKVEAKEVQAIKETLEIDPIILRFSSPFDK